LLLLLLLLLFSMGGRMIAPEGARVTGAEVLGWSETEAVVIAIGGGGFLGDEEPTGGFFGFGEDDPQPMSEIFFF
jgi:hypothetical protein